MLSVLFRDNISLVHFPDTIKDRSFSPPHPASPGSVRGDYAMNADAFRDELRSKAVRSAGQYNINATKMRTMKIPIPPLVEQKSFVKTVEALEAEISTAESIISAAPAKKEAVLKKYL